MKFDIDLLIDNGIVVHCMTKEEAEKFLGYLHDCGFTWFSGKSLKDHTFWDELERDTCYAIWRNETEPFVSFEDSSFFLKSGYAVMPYSALEFEEGGKKDEI